jgi:hypothetical protein
MHPNDNPDAEPIRCEYCLKLCNSQFCSDKCKRDQEDYDRVMRIHVHYVFDGYQVWITTRPDENPIRMDGKEIALEPAVLEALMDYYEREYSKLNKENNQNEA